MRAGASGMQGWRLNMEDAHICEPTLEKNTSLFAVFDGHGGKEVAVFCSRHFGEELKKCPSYKMKNYEQALIDTFLKMDEMVDTVKGKQELIQIGKDFPEKKSPLTSALGIGG